MTTLEALSAEFEHAKTTGGMSLERSRVWLALWQQQQEIRGERMEIDARPFDVVKFHDDEQRPQQGVVMATELYHVNVRSRSRAVRVPNASIIEIRHAPDRPGDEVRAICHACAHSITGTVEWSPSGFPLCGGECGF